MGYPLTTAYYHIVHTRTGGSGTIVRNKPKFPKGKAEKKAWKRRTHQKDHYFIIKALRRFKQVLAEVEARSAK